MTLKQSAFTSRGFALAALLTGVSVAGASYGQASTPLAASGNLPTVSAPGSITAPAGQAVYKGGQAATIASGAHGGGPAPVVNGADPDAKGFTTGVTNGTAEIGKGGKAAGKNYQSGATLNPQGAIKGAKTVPSREQAPLAQAQSVATTPLKTGSVDQTAGSAVAKGGQAVVIAGGGHGGGPAPIVSGASPQASPFTSGVTGGLTKIGKGGKETGGAIENGTALSPSGALTGAAKAPTGLETQARAAGSTLGK